MVLKARWTLAVVIGGVSARVSRRRVACGAESRGKFATDLIVRNCTVPTGGT